MREYIHRCGFRNHAVVSKPYLRPCHLIARKRWANMHQNWDVGQWNEVAFSDESRFTLKPTSLRKQAGGSKGNVTEL